MLCFHINLVGKMFAAIGLLKFSVHFVDVTVASMCWMTFCWYLLRLKKKLGSDLAQPLWLGTMDPLLDPLLTADVRPVSWVHPLSARCPLFQSPMCV